MVTSSIVAVIQTRSPRTSNSIPISVSDCPGTSSSEDTTRIVSNIIKARSARLGKLGMDNILVKLIETPTKIKPSRAAEAPTSAIKKFSQPFISNNPINADFSDFLAAAAAISPGTL